MKRVLLSFLALVMVMGLISPVSITDAQESDDCFAELNVMTTEDGVEFVRTPDVCFEDLPDWLYEANYVDIDGLRQGYVDYGTGESGETILLLHGQPSWSYLYRKMIPILAEEGHRVIAMDHLGFGLSDKPIDPDYYTYLGHVERLETFIQELELEQGNLTVFVQDWGSLIGLQVIGAHPEWFDRVVVGNGFLPVFEEGTMPSPLPENTTLTRNIFHNFIANSDPQQPPFYDEDGNPINRGGNMPESTEDTNLESGFGIWIDYARNDERFRPEMIVEALTYYDLPEDEEAGYAAPFPSRITMGGPRAFPGLVNQMPGLTQDSWNSLGEFDNPFLTIWGGNDPGNLGNPLVQQMLLSHVPGTEGWDHVRLPDASHFLQDDQGEEIARRMNAFITQSPIVDDSASEAETHVGFEILEVVSPTEIRAWVLQDEMALAEFEALELPEGWLKNQPREGDVDGGEFTRSPDGEFDGDRLIEEHFGYEWLHTATVTNINVAVDEQGLLNGSYVNKYHTVTYDAATIVPVLLSPEGEAFVRIGRDAGRSSDEFAIPDGWQLIEYVTPDVLSIDLPRPTLVIRTENQDSFQGPVEELSALADEAF